MDGRRSLQRLPRNFVRPHAARNRLIVGGCWMAALLLSAGYWWVTRFDTVPASTQVGRAYGLAGILLLAALSLLWPQSRYYTWFGRIPLQTYYHGHLLLSVVTLAVLGCHCFSGVLGMPEIWQLHGPEAALRHPFRSGFLVFLQLSFWGVLLTGFLLWRFQKARARCMKDAREPVSLVALDKARVTAKKELLALLPAQEMPSSTLDEETNVDRRLRGAGLRQTRAWAGHLRAGAWAVSPQLLQRVPEASDPHSRVRQALDDLNRLEARHAAHARVAAMRTLHLWGMAAVWYATILHLYLVATSPR